MTEAMAKWLDENKDKPVKLSWNLTGTGYTNGVLIEWSAWGLILETNGSQRAVPWSSILYLEEAIEDD